MSKAETGGRGQAVDREALKARVDYAIELANWADQAPQAPQTMAKTINDIIAETCAKLAKIAACYDLREALNDATDGQVLSDDPVADEYFEQIKQETTDAMGRLGCSSIL